MLSVKQGLILICVVATVIISVAIATRPSEEASFEKIGKIRRIEFSEPLPRHWRFCPLTYVEFEDGDALEFWGILNNFEEGKTYRIVYQKKDRIVVNRDPGHDWLHTATETNKVNVVEEIEEIFP